MRTIKYTTNVLSIRIRTEEEKKLRLQIINGTIQIKVVGFNYIFASIDEGYD
jgi:hypothetical protein